MLRRTSIIDLGGHISELAAQRMARVADAVQIGDRVRVCIVGSDPDAADSSSIRPVDAPK